MVGTRGESIVKSGANTPPVAAMRGIGIASSNLARPTLRWSRGHLHFDLRKEAGLRVIF